MKKLNITKEQFEKSRYFKNKYGRLEYVSESGRLFKTNKGKVLMFNEAIKDIAPGIQDWGTTIYVEPLGAELDWETVFSYVKHDCRQFPLLEQEIGVEPYETPSNRQIRNWIKTKPESFIDYLKECGYYDHLSELTAADDDSYDESTKKSGRKFNESDDEIRDAVNDAFDKYRACSTVPKVCQAIKINDDGTEKKIGIWMDHGNSIGGIVKAIKDGRLRKVLKFSESSKPKFVKESYHGRVEVEASIIATGRTAEEALEFLHNRLLDADAKIIDENEKPNPEIVDKYNYWFDENMGDVDFDICRDNNPNGFIQMGIKSI